MKGLNNIISLGYDYKSGNCSCSYVELRLQRPQIFPDLFGGALDLGFRRSRDQGVLGHIVRD